MRRLRVLTGFVSAILVGILAGSVTGCSSHTASPPASLSKPPQWIVVFAAASLKPTFTQIADRFKTDNPGSRIEFHFEGSSELAARLIDGVSADVFASADTAQMNKVANDGLVAGTPVNFASNTLVIVTAPGNPKKVESFADLAKPGLDVAVCQPPVPCGAATQRIEDNTGVHLTPVSEEPDVTDVLNKVTSGKADAGLVYVTDALDAGDKVTTVKFPEATGAVNVYPIAVLGTGLHPALAHKFVDLVTGEAGQKILHQAGFAKP
jgi:molybdate transport system substrate-binding protein